MMEGVQLSWWFIGAYLALMLGVGVWFRRRVRSVEDMAVAGRNSGVWLIAFSVAATWINGTTLIGISALGADFGLDAYWSGGSFMLGTIWIAYFIIPRLWGTGVITIPELFGRYFGPRHRVVSLVLIIMRDMGVTAGTIGALTLVTTTVLGMSVGESLLLWLGVTSVYVFLGGMWAVMATDAIQFFIILAGSIGVLVGGLAAAGGLGGLRADLDPALLDTFGRAGVTQVLAWIVIGLAITGAYQGLIQRGFAASSAAVARKGFLYGGIIASIWYMTPPLTGIIARTIYGPEMAAEDAFVTLAFGAAGDELASLVVVCVLAASMSTLSSTINTIASNFTLDLYVRFFAPAASPARQLWVYRINVLIVGALAAVLYLALPLLIELFWIGGRIMGASVAPALVGLVLFRSVREAPRTVMAAMLIGGGVQAAWQAFGAIREVGAVVIIWELDPILVGLPLTILILWVGTRLETRAGGRRAAT